MLLSMCDKAVVSLMSLFFPAKFLKSKSLVEYLVRLLVVVEECDSRLLGSGGSFLKVFCCLCLVSKIMFCGLLTNASKENSAMLSIVKSPRC